jgi:hypothetical protein
MQDDIDRILNGPTYTTDEREAEGPVRVIDVHIYDLPEEEQPPTVESTPPTPEPEAQAEAEAETPPPAKTHKRLIPWLVAGLCCLILATLLTVFSLLPLFTLQATVTLVPVSRQLPPVHTTLHIVNGSTSGNQIPGRALPAISMSQQQTAPTTGTGHQNATPGRGYITFYNASLVEQTVPDGTLLTGSDGVEVVTDQNATIPAEKNLATNGSTSVAAHTVQTGPQANIQAGDIYGPCCRLNVSAANSAFSGGQNARTYQSVKQSDIGTTVNALKTSLNASIQAALQAQVRGNETLLTPLACNKPQISTDHQAGDEAQNVTVTMSATCTGEVYDTAAYKQTIEHITTQAAQTTYGNGYSQEGELQTTIQETHATDHGVDLMVQLTGAYVYHFSSSDLAHMKTLIAGKSKAEATRLLLQTKGIQSVSITLSEGGTIPTDTNHITLSWLSY